MAGLLDARRWIVAAGSGSASGAIASSMASVSIFQRGCDVIVVGEREEEKKNRRYRGSSWRTFIGIALKRAFCLSEGEDLQ